MLASLRIFAMESSPQMKPGLEFDELQRNSLTNYRLLADDDRSPHWLNGFRTLPLETRAERCVIRNKLLYRRAFRNRHNDTTPCRIISTGKKWHKAPGQTRDVRKIRVKIVLENETKLGWLFADICCGAGDGDCTEPPDPNCDGMCRWCWEHWSQQLDDDR